MPQIKLPMNRIRALVNEMESRFDPDILARGWNYFHQGRVGALELRHGHELAAQVRGTKRYEAVLDLDNFEQSGCSCPYGEECKHMAALLFQAYAPHGRPELLLREMQQAMRAKGRRAAAVRTVKRADPADLAPGDSPRRWQEAFERRFRGFSLSHQQSVEAFAAAARQTLEPLAAEWEAPLKPLFALHVQLFVLRRIDGFYRENKNSYLSYYIETGCRKAATAAREGLVEAAEQIQPETVRKKYPEHWRETAAIAGELALEAANEAVDWLDVYRFLWWKLFTANEERKREQARLSRLLEEPGQTPRKKDALLLALSHFSIMEGRDTEAVERLEGLQTRQVADFYTVLQQLSGEEEWDRLMVWLRWLLPAMPRAKQEDFHRVCGYWMEAMKHLPSDEEWIRAMLELLPRSYYYYTDYLMKSGRYRQWVDLQLSSRVSPSNLYTAQLKEVEAADPSLLLPLYHQAVERSILEKNRASYKVAVRFLRKLHMYYRKKKQLDRWEDYIHRLARKYTRLRAFQEELKKGKWIT